MTRAVVRASIALLTLSLALSGCSRLGAASMPSPTPANAVSSSAPADTSSPGASSNSSSLDSITQDLNSADDANTQAGSNQQSADQAAATSDG